MHELSAPGALFVVYVVYGAGVIRRPPFVFGTPLAFTTRLQIMNPIARLARAVGALLLSATLSAAAAEQARGIVVRAILAEDEAQKLTLIASLIGQGDES